MKTYIVISPQVWNDDVKRYEELEDGTIIHRYFLRTAIIQTDNELLIDWLAEQVDISIDDVISLFYLPNDTLKNYKWEHYSTQRSGNNTCDFFDRFNGNFEYSSKAVAVIDTGILSHPDLNDNRISINYNGQTVWGFKVSGTNIIPRTSISSEEYLHPHGTHVAGIVGAVGNNNKGVFGVYFKNKLFSINVFERIGGGVGAYTSSILTALNLCGQLNGSIRTINMSLGGGYSEAFYKALNDAYEYLNEQEIAVVVASGNSNVDVSVLKPLPAYCKTNNSFTVGSSNIYGVKSWFSNYNDTIVDVMVAGGTAERALTEHKFTDEDILSPVPYDCNDDYYSIITEGNAKYGWMAGTSMASPYVAGLINILFDVININDFNEALELIRKILVGATYLHSREAFNQSACGGILDCRLIKGLLVYPKILEYQYDDEHQKLKVKIQNYNQASTIFVSASVARFTAKNEISNPDVLVYSEFNFNADEIKWVELSLTIEQFWGNEQIGVLAGIYNGNSNIGFYDKLRIYNKIECPLPPLYCYSINIRCDGNDYFPFNITNLNMLQGGLISTLAERAQKRLLFWRNSTKNIYNKYNQFLPVSTSGICINTTNYPNIKNQFPARLDATQNDLLIGLWSIYIQLKEIYQNGILGEDGKRWYIFDYQYWREQGKSKFRRKQLPAEYVLDESYCRLDKISKLIQAIQMMIYWGKVVFYVNYGLQYQMSVNYSYSARYNKDLTPSDLVEEPVNIALVATTAQINTGTPPSYTDGQGRLRYRIPVFNDPFDVTVPIQTGYKYFGDGTVRKYENGVMKAEYVRNTIAGIVSAVGIKSNYTRGFWTCVEQTGLYTTIPTKYQFYVFPTTLKINTPTTETEQYPTPVFNNPINWNGGAVNTSYYFDRPPHTLFGWEDYYLPYPIEYFEINEQTKIFRASTIYLIEADKFLSIQIDTVRMAFGHSTKLQPVLGYYCWQPAEIPVSLTIVKSGSMSNHWDTASLNESEYPQNLRNYKYDFPHGQFISCTFEVKVSIVDVSGNKTEKYNKTITIINSSNPSFNEIVETITIDVPYGYYILIETRPLESFKNNSTHTLIIPAFAENTEFEMPPFTKHYFVYPAQSGNWEVDNQAIYSPLHTYPVYGTAVYTRDTGVNIYIYPSQDNSVKNKYEDIRGLPVDEYFDSILNSLNMVKAPFTIDETEYQYYPLNCCGWEDLSDKISARIVVDQLPPQLYPKHFTDNLGRLKVITAEASLGAKIEYKHYPQLKNVARYQIDASNKDEFNYVCPSNQTQYKSELNFRIGIKGVKYSFYPDLIGNTIEEAGEILGNDFTVEEIDDYYFEGEENKILYQFPNKYLLIDDNSRTVYVITGGKNKDDYELKLIPDLTQMSNHEIEALIGNENSFIHSFDIVLKYAPAGTENCIEYQFPRNCAYCKKGNSKYKMFLVVGKKSYELVCKILNRSMLL